MKVIKTKKQRGSFLLRVAIFAFAVYTVVLLVNQQVQISEKQQQLSNIKKQIQVQEIKNEDIKHALSTGANASSDYMERLARAGLNLASPVSVFL